jgi:DNA-binding helix-hairpin-helix protein with protein kinase domain
MTVLQSVKNQYKISLKRRIASGGEGDIWSTNIVGVLAKIYHSPNEDKIGKLEYMLQNPPLDKMLSKKHVSIAWPIDLLKDLEANKIVGFLMQRIDNGKTLINLYNLQARLVEAPGIDWYHLHVIAENVAIIVESIHNKGYVIGDLKPQNLLVPEDTLLVSIVDTDSFQISDINTGRIYGCPVGTAEFTPPELYGQSLKETVRSEIHDLFSLGVIIYLLLFGEHPFSGIVRESKKSEILSSVDRRISQGSWPYAPNSPICRRPLSIPLDIVHPILQQHFYSCFTLGHKNPDLRPKASAWKEALSIARKDLMKCDKVLSHRFNKSYGKCFWCEMKSTKNLDFFPDDINIEEYITARSPAPATTKRPLVTDPAQPASNPTQSIAKQNSSAGAWVVALILIGINVIVLAIIIFVS